MDGSVEEKYWYYEYDVCLGCVREDVGMYVDERSCGELRRRTGGKAKKMGIIMGYYETQQSGFDRVLS
jgi:hypothetical protein